MTAVLLGTYEAGSPEWHEQRAGRVGGSDIATILGLSPWHSPFEEWHKRKGLIGQDAELPRQSWGKRLEPVIVQAYAETMSEALELYYRPGAVWAHPDRPWQVASPDALIQRRDATIVLHSGLEVKCSRYPDGWGEPGSDDIPVYYRAQVLWCMDVFDVPTWNVAVLIGGSDYREYVVHRDDTELAVMRDAAQAFLASLDRNERPDIDSSTATYETVRRLHPAIDPDAEVELDRTTALDYLAAVAQADRAIAELTRAKSALLDAMGNAKHATYAGTRIARRQPGRGDSVSLYQIKDAAA